MTEPLDGPALLDIFHRQIRLGRGEGGAGALRERVGPVFRLISTDRQDPWAMVDAPEGLGEDPDAVIAGERDHFAGQGIPLEFKTYSYDEPADLGARLLRAGFVKGDDEALMLGELTALSAPVPLPESVRIRQVRTRGDARRVRELYAVVWGGAWGSADSDDGRDEEMLPPGDPAELSLLAEEDPQGPVLCAARLTLETGSDFAGLWGGSTHPAWRRRGLYRALAAERARVALRAGHRYARVDASPNSEPILSTLGLHRVATTTPFTFGSRH